MADEMLKHSGESSMIGLEYDDVDKFLIDAASAGPTFTMLIAPDPDSKDYVLFQIYPVVIPPFPPCPIAKMRKNLIQRVEVIDQVNCIRTIPPPLPFGRAWKAKVTLRPAESKQDEEALSLITAIAEMAIAFQQRSQGGQVEPASGCCAT